MILKQCKICTNYLFMAGKRESFTLTFIVTCCSDLHELTTLFYRKGRMSKGYFCDIRYLEVYPTGHKIFYIIFTIFYILQIYKQSDSYQILNSQAIQSNILYFSAKYV